MQENIKILVNQQTPSTEIPKTCTGIPIPRNKVASWVLFLFYNFLLPPGCNTQSLYLKRENTGTRRPAGRKPSNSDQTSHVNGDLRQHGLFELPHKQTVNELVQVCRALCGKGPAPHLAPVGPVLETLLLPSPFSPQEKVLVGVQKKSKRAFGRRGSSRWQFLEGFKMKSDDGEEGGL